ncbi:MAG: FAD-dependent monooxygenase [Bacteroidia bacterium]
MEYKKRVIISGGGPTGLVLANLLGKLGVRTLIIEKEASVFSIPRATHLDEETLRNFQLTGLIPELIKHTVPVGVMQIVSESGEIMLEEKVMQPNSVHNYAGSRFFDQPAFEQILWEGLSHFPHVEIWRGFETIQVSQNIDNVSVTIQNTTTKEEIKLGGEWLVACDGGRSFVRTFLDIQMEAFDERKDWIIVDTLLKKEEDAHLLPSCFSYFLKKPRLHLFAYGIGKNNRWEFPLHKEEEMPKEELIKSWVADYIPLEKIEFTRIAKYSHNTLVSEKWRDGRIFLAGDAAHLMPPFAGQGLCSGVRDAVNLAWKLNQVLEGKSPALLDTYTLERKPHLLQIFKRTLFLSHNLHVEGFLKTLKREILIKTVSFFSSIKDLISEKINIPDKISDGFLYEKSVLAGEHLPQFTVFNEQLTDDIIGYQFALIARTNTFTESQIMTLKDKNVFILSEEIDIETTPFPNWLAEKQTDFVIVRPDKIIFGAGKKVDFEKIVAALVN